MIGLGAVSTTKLYDDERDRNDNSHAHSQLSRDSFNPDEEITRVLTTENPHVPKNLVMFSNREKRFVPLGNTEQLIIHYSYEGNLLPVDSEEAKSYLQKGKQYGTSILPTALLDAYQTKTNPKIQFEQFDDNASQQIDDEDERRTIASDITEQSDVNEPIDDLTPIEHVQSSSSLGKSKKILNRFNFCEQGIQTYIPPKKDATTVTDPVPHIKFVGLANQRIIYQAYRVDFEKQQKDKDKSKTKNSYGPTKGVLEKRMVKTDRLKVEASLKRRQVQILKAIERVLNQNRHHQLIYNFKYFEDEADEIRDPMGTLFPLWKFPPSLPDRAVTVLTWNPAYSDMLIIGYGLYDRAERIQGTIAVFTLNNNHPNNLIHTESTVLSIDCLPSKPYLVCVGLMDGDVLVYDISVSSGKAVFTNSSYLCKHLGSVWQVRWCTSSTNHHHPRFCSAGGDGKVMRWTCIKNELRQVLLLDLPSAMKATRLDDGTVLTIPGPALALDFHRTRKDVFLVGTEDGKIYKASINDPGIIDTTFDAHDFAIYAIQWSPFHPNIFASCSADGTVKIWHDKIPDCLMRFDLCTSLRDVSWSPYTSTMFAVVGADGKVYVFDIHSNKLEPVCEQLLAHQPGRSCTKIAFNSVHPILLAGDESGWTTCLKLSPNLRKKAKVRKGIEVAQNYEPEFDKLAQELTRTITGDGTNAILITQIADTED